MARSLQLASSKDWQAWCKSGACPANVPYQPEVVYKHGGWQGYGHWLGTRKQARAKFLPFAEALAGARALQLGSEQAWADWATTAARAPNVPADPAKTYKHSGWRGWGHWLGAGTGDPEATPFLPFEEALGVSRALHLASAREWRVWSKSGARAPGMPAAPDEAYKHTGWQGWGHWLDTSWQACGSLIEAGGAKSVRAKKKR